MMVRHLFEEPSFFNLKQCWFPILNLYETLSKTDVIVKVYADNSGEVKSGDTFLFKFSDITEFEIKLGLLQMFLEKELNVENYHTFLSWEAH